jgi:putative addiction module killer protein
MRIEQTEDFKAWLDRLKDLSARARVLMRIDRLAHGNPGNFRNLSGGLSELKVDVGPGYRVYYAMSGDELLLLLVGGDKSTQDKDIKKARRILETWLE